MPLVVEKNNMHLFLDWPRDQNIASKVELGSNNPIARELYGKTLWVRVSCTTEHLMSTLDLGAHV